ncbi:hypothetical protein [Streptomyces sp. NRRL S-244]|uniref:hypothetical protein n=1 Tax=Streptomyces sp. NRRL S-244 TaxID=1463897 RepID=UPI001F2A4D37|nr:hypothetical protein [Streptomyces sp. NRRL S-244]
MPSEGVRPATRPMVCFGRPFRTSWPASPVDLLVAVTAQHHKLTVLHQDADFETIARITGQPVRRIAD